ncbi:YicC/YloC family endoribonuclease [Maritalea mediterranea]|uniref:YicC family protein n=1 Tax=Maritalea mediterranea TaxID=2909667 RepID=A0ABS9E5E4_9HYPH|nr:YicC/YloC family endoribonuclease [Maritalea mediterranea]MCF4098089.1 YicC family protein [Maritalea mediterranea]
MSKPIASMTGFARAAGGISGAAFNLEIKSVNARGLDLRLRVPPGLDDLENLLRQKLTKALTRGAVQVNLNISYEHLQSEVSVNQQALQTVIDAIGQLSAKVEADKPRLDGILGLKGVLELSEAKLSEKELGDLKQAVLDAADNTISDLIASREAEGLNIHAFLTQRLVEIAELTLKAEEHPARSREAILEKLNNQIALLQEGENGLAEDRLHAEALVLATKADIREELDRLVAHVAAARKLLKQGGPVGRKLDFLSQEFNREANTLCSKSNHVDLTAIGLDLKAAIDQLREQVQNIE